MGPWKPLLASAAAAICAVAAMSVLPLAERQANHGDVAVFKTEQVRRLSNDNLVDALVSLSLTERLKRAEWRNGVLTVDIKVSPGADDPAPLFGDLARLVTLAFKMTGNAERLLVRFIDEPAPSGGARLLLAADIRRGDRWLRDVPGLPGGRDILGNPLWRSRLRLAFTSAWHDRFDAPLQS